MQLSFKKHVPILHQKRYSSKTYDDEKKSYILLLELTLFSDSFLFGAVHTGGVMVRQTQ